MHMRCELSDCANGAASFEKLWQPHPDDAAFRVPDGFIGFRDDALDYPRILGAGYSLAPYLPWLTYAKCAAGELIMSEA